MNRALLILAVLLTMRNTLPLQAQDAIIGTTTVAADTGGFFYRAEGLSAWVRTQRGKGLAPADPGCVHSGHSQRDTVRVLSVLSIRAGSTTYRLTWRLKPDERQDGPWSMVLPSGSRLIVLWVEAPRSPCGVNPGQVWFHWRLEPAAHAD